jgi:putative MATE family efflux protein
MLSLPIMASSAMQMAYNVADTFWLGRVGAEAVAALSISWPLIFLMISIAAGFSVAGTTLVAQYTGAGKPEEADHVASQVFVLLILLGVSLSLLGVVLAKNLMVLVGAPDAVLPLATSYTRIIFGGVVLMFGGFVFQAIISGHGDTVTPMKLMLVTVVLNLVLDPFLIFGIGPFPEMGIVGAAVATVLSRGVASAIGFYYLFSGSKGIMVRISDLRPRPNTISRIVRIGVPSAIEQSAMALGFTFMVAIVARFGTDALAAYGIGSRLISLLSMPAMGFGMAVSIMVGQSLGAGKEDRAEKIGWLSSGASLLLLTGGGALCYLSAGALVSVFITQNDQAVIGLGSQFIRIIAFGLGAFAARTVINGAFRGAGDTITAMAFSVLALWGIRLPLAAVLSVSIGIEGVWISMLLSNLIGCAAALLWFRRGGWKRKSISNRGWGQTDPNQDKN